MTLTETLFAPLKAQSKSLLRHNIYLLPAGYSGCAWWRYRLVFNKLKSLGSCLNINIADNPNKQLRMEDIQKHVADSDLISLQAPGYKDALTLMKLYKSEGKKVVIDYDDYSFDLSPGNPRFAELGCMECELNDADGKLIYRWRDGENGFDLKSNIAKFEAFKECVGVADLITTTTDYLANQFRPLNKNVAICPNSIDFDLWKPIQRPENTKDQIRIGWFGGDSHFVDLEPLKQLFPRIIKKYPNVKLVMQAPMVPEWGQIFKDVPADNLEWHNWADLRYYTLFLASRHFDIGLCPLADNDFNRAKSAIKWMEFAALGASVVAQDMLPYNQFIDGKNGLLATTEDEWFEQISKLIDDAEFRKNIAKIAYTDVLSHHNLDYNCRIWEREFLRCIER